MSAQAINITPGEHIEWKLGPLTLNGDTVTATLIAGAILLILGLLVARRSSTGKPSKLQIATDWSCARSRTRSRARWASAPRPGSCPSPSRCSCSS